MIRTSTQAAARSETSDNPDYLTLRVPVRRAPPTVRGHVSVQPEFNASLGDGGFAMTVKGRDLQPYGLCDGDILLCRRQSSALPGQLVAIPGLVQDGMCIRVYPHAGDSLLLPDGTRDPLVLAAPPRSIHDVYAVVVAVDRPHQTFWLAQPPAPLSPPSRAPRRQRHTPPPHGS